MMEPSGLTDTVQFMLERPIQLLPAAGTGLSAAGLGYAIYQFYKCRRTAKELDRLAERVQDSQRFALQPRMHEDSIYERSPPAPPSSYYFHILEFPKRNVTVTDSYNEDIAPLLTEHYRNDHATDDR